MLSRIWKRVEGFDLAYRPGSYFWPLGLRDHLLATVKGRFRRALLTEEDGDGRPPPGVADMLARESIPEPMRRTLGRIHPTLMGGEYLPDLRAGEVEIARVSLASVTADVIAVRARRTAKGIKYRMVDEYETEYTIAPRYTRRPLAMLQLIRLIEGTRPDSPTLDTIRVNLANDADWDSMESFVTVSSPFYPELQRWYGRYLGLWFDSRRRRGHARRRPARAAAAQGRLFLVAGKAGDAGNGGPA